MFPINIYDGKKFPDKTSYLIAKNGIYLYKKIKTIQSLTKVENISFLKSVKPFVELNIEQIPNNILLQAVGFFKYIYNKYMSEAGLLIHYFSGKYELYCPEQKVSSGYMSWKNDKHSIPNNDGILIGTIHSHGLSPAFHSSIDINNEKDFDGIHITIGNVTTKPTIVCSIVINNNRFLLDKKEITKYLDISFENDDTDKIDDSYHSFLNYNNNNIFRLDNCNFNFPNKWIDKVKHKEPVYYKFINGKFEKNLFDKNQNNISYDKYIDYDLKDSNDLYQSKCDNCEYKNIAMKTIENNYNNNDKKLSKYDIHFDEHGNMIDDNNNKIGE